VVQKTDLQASGFSKFPANPAITGTMIKLTVPAKKIVLNISTILNPFMILLEIIKFIFIDYIKITKITIYQLF